MKWKLDKDHYIIIGRRAPQGARGLKYLDYRRKSYLHGSRPARGAWIEI